MNTLVKIKFKNMIRYINILLILFGALNYAHGQSDGKFEQTDKGSHLAGGTISFNNTFTNKTNLFSGNLNPNYGYFFANNLAIGGVLSLTYSASPSNHSTLATLSPFVRYYIGPPKTCMFFGYASAGGGVQSNNNTSVGLYNFQVGPGFDYFVNKHVALEALMSYRGSKLARSGSDYSNNVGLLIGLQVFF
jgi:hypothetical protein